MYNKNILIFYYNIFTIICCDIIIVIYIITINMHLESLEWIIIYENVC